MLLFPCRRLILCLGIDFIKNHTEWAFAFYLCESDVSEKTTDQQQRPTMLNNPANDFHRGNHSVCWLINQARLVVLSSKTSRFLPVGSLYWTGILNGNKRST